MAHVALYRKWRPRTFEDVVDQSHIVQTLRHSVTDDNIAHAYLFCGTRGTGKTSLAKIFAAAINCRQPNRGDPCGTCDICTGLLDNSLMDILEIDAASNNSVDNIRRITDEVAFLPTTARYKVYIIDEVHMLSSGAFNALLKTLEEPPEHAVFILATTEAHRIPATITSRCQRFDFRRIAPAHMQQRLRRIADAEGIPIQDDALTEITAQADGAMRDAISLLDQCQSGIEGTITRRDVRSLIGVVDLTFMADLVDHIADGNIHAILDAVDSLVQAGNDVIRFTSDLAGYYRDLMICLACENPDGLIGGQPEDAVRMRAQAARYQQPEIVAIIKHLSALIGDLKWAGNPRTLLEIHLLSITGTLQNPTRESPLPLHRASASQPQKSATEPAAPERSQDPRPAPAPAAPTDQTAEPFIDADSPVKAELPITAAPVPDEPAPEDPPSAPAPPAASAAPELPAATKPPLAAPDEPVHGGSPLWTETLKRLKESDTFIYCFATAASVSGTGSAITLTFANTAQKNYSILTEQRGNRPLSDALRKANHGHPVQVNVVMRDEARESAAAGSVAPGTEWIAELTARAGAIGLQIEREDLSDGER